MTKRLLSLIFASAILFTGFVFPTLAVEIDGSTQCSDGVDNDRDGVTDYPADKSCSSPSDNTENTKDPVAPTKPAPSAPGNFSVTGDAFSQNLSYTAAGTNGGSPVDFHKLYLDGNFQTNYGPGNNTFSRTDRLSAGNHLYAVTGVNRDGVEGPAATKILEIKDQGTTGGGGSTGGGSTGGPVGGALSSGCGTGTLNDNCITIISTGTTNTIASGSFDSEYGDVTISFSIGRQITSADSIDIDFTGDFQASCGVNNTEISITPGNITVDDHNPCGNSRNNINIYTLKPTVGAIIAPNTTITLGLTIIQNPQTGGDYPVQIKLLNESKSGAIKIGPQDCTWCWLQRIWETLTNIPALLIESVLKVFSVIIGDFISFVLKLSFSMLRAVIEGGLNF